jgi:hypothetical protein
VQITIVAGQGIAGQRLLDQIGAVLDPLADQYRGADPVALRPVLARAWGTAFHTELREPALSRAAAAIATGQPWQWALWSNDWP